MKRNLKEQILSLRAQNKTIKEIQSILHCSSATVAYYLYSQAKRRTKERAKQNRKPYKATNRSILFNKYYNFFRIGHRSSKVIHERNFTFEEFMSFISNHDTCYLSGEKLDKSSPSGFSLDHKVPSSKGGKNSLENLGLCSAIVNRCKSDLTPDEFLSLCKVVLEHHGFTVSKA